MPGQRISQVSVTSDYSTGSGSFGDASSFLKVQLPNSGNDGMFRPGVTFNSVHLWHIADLSVYEPLNTKAMMENSGKQNHSFFLGAMY